MYIFICKIIGINHLHFRDTQPFTVIKLCICCCFHSIGGVYGGQGLGPGGRGTGIGPGGQGTGLGAGGLGPGGGVGPGGVGPGGVGPGGYGPGGGVGPGGVGPGGYGPGGTNSNLEIDHTLQWIVISLLKLLIKLVLMQNVPFSDFVGYAGAKARKYGNVTQTILNFKLYSNVQWC